MLRLYDYGPSPNCFKPRLLLAQLELPYERVDVDIFAGETLTDEHLARNAAGRVPVLELDSGDCLPESNAILLYLAEGTPFLPEGALERAQVHRWLFFEQNLLEPNVGTAQFLRLTGRAASRPEVFAQRVEAGTKAIAILERHFAGSRFAAGDDYTVADIALYAYAYKAPDAGIDLDASPAVRAWLERVEATPRFANDVAPYPPNAMAGAGQSIHG